MFVIENLINVTKLIFYRLKVNLVITFVRAEVVYCQIVKLQDESQSHVQVISRFPQLDQLWRQVTDVFQLLGHLHTHFKGTQIGQKVIKSIYLH